mgnify:CR=1 FL=1
MKGKFFAFTSRLKYINRWALMRNTHEENLSEHCMETACIAHALAVIGNRRFGKYYNAERAALLGLYHDAPETLIAGTGKFAQLHAAWRESLV